MAVVVGIIFVSVGCCTCGALVKAINPSTRLPPPIEQPASEVEVEVAPEVEPDVAPEADTVEDPPEEEAAPAPEPPRPQKNRRE